MDLSSVWFYDRLLKNISSVSIHSFVSKAGTKEIDVSFKITDESKETILDWKNATDFSNLISEAFNPKLDPDNKYHQSIQDLFRQIIKSVAQKKLTQHKKELEKILANIS